MKTNVSIPAVVGKQQRRGVSAVLVVAMLFVFIVSAALTVDVAYMQLIRTELRVATDAAAQAGAEALARTEDTATAIAAAKTYAQRNNVAGTPFRIRDSDVQLGRVELAASGKWEFTAGLTPPNSVRVLGRISDNARTKSKPLFFAPALGHSNFSTQHSATAAEQNVEVCLCLDRSGSMLFDLSGVDWAYAKPNPSLINFTAWGETWQYHLSPPHPTDSRWTVLAGAVNLFLAEVGSNVRPPRVSLVTWSSNYQMPISPFTWYSASTVDVALPALASHQWSDNSSSIQSSISSLSSIPMMGGTNMSAGIDAAVSQLTTGNATGLANKVIILLSDGVWNDGRDPYDAAVDAHDAGITIHTISMLSTDQQTLVDVANATGGKFYSANDAAALSAAFVELARTLPIILTD